MADITSFDDQKYSMKCRYCTKWNSMLPLSMDRGKCVKYNKEIGGVFWCSEGYEIDKNKVKGLIGVPE